MTTKTAHDILTDWLYDPDNGVDTERSGHEAKAIMNNLKYEGFIIIKADSLVKQISDSMGGGQHE